MTTQTAPIDGLRTAVATAQTALDAIRAESTEKLIAAINAGDTAEQDRLIDARRAAEATLRLAADALAAAEKDSLWEQSVEARTAITNVASATYESPASISPTHYEGVILITAETAEDGTESAEAAVKLVAKLPALDASAFEALIAEHTDAAYFLSKGILSLDINIDIAARKVTLIPTAARTAQTRNVKAASAAAADAPAGALEYEYPTGSGTWLGTKAFLMAVEAAALPSATRVEPTKDGSKNRTDRPAAFERAIRGDGNRLSGLGKAVAAEIGAVSRVKAAATA